ncbi:MAG: ComEA family DNA-binding protein [Chloroflexota bacterium]|nr:ComEA family DNA-binding protein [Dehalococcoidia bacterium]MDW8254110.1 ComEA family DNA-binding protein [Chloroflexota bacterium]
MEKSAPPALSTLLLLLMSATLVALALLLARSWVERPEPVQIVPLPLDPSIKVAVRGAVVSPGVYTLRLGDRVEDAIRAAGGLTPDAEERAINPAARVADEQEIWVPRRGDEIGRPPATPTPAAKVNLNTATAAELIALPGIAELTASRIIESRERVGPFRRVEELRERGIMNERNFELVKDRVTAP